MSSAAWFSTLVAQLFLARAGPVRQMGPMFELSPRLRLGGVVAIFALTACGAFAASCAAGDDGSGDDGGGSSSPDAGEVADVATGDGGATPLGDAGASDAGTNDAAPQDDAAAIDGATTRDAEGAPDAKNEDAGSDAQARDSGARDSGGAEDASADAPSDRSDAHESDAEADSSTDAQPVDAGSDAERPVDGGPVSDSSSADAGQDAAPPADANVPDAADAGCGTAAVLVNEVQTSGPKGAEDEWVELFNPQSCPLDIAGFTVRHTSASGTSIATVFTAGAGTTLGPQGYGVIAGTKYSATPTPIGSFNSGVLADQGGGLGLYDASGTLVSSMGYGTGATNPFVETSPAPSEASSESIARIPNGVETGDNAIDFRSSAPTPAAAN
jgi:hypothetical protein